MKDDGARIIVVGRDVGEPFDVAAEPIAGILHDQRVDTARCHLVPDCGPAPLELASGNAGGDAFNVGHVSSFGSD
jgi:hypothetical protein